jgi:hypothetical protein
MMPLQLYVSCSLQIEESIKQELPILKLALERVHEFVAMLKIKSIERRERAASVPHHGHQAPVRKAEGKRYSQC